MNIERGDTVKFGVEWCKVYRSEHLINKTVKLTPQWFEDDNGLYTYDVECPGIYDEENQEAESIYHLFGNDFENFMDCELIKGTVADIEEYEKIIKDQRDAEAMQWEEYGKTIQNQIDGELGN